MNADILGLVARCGWATASWEPAAPLHGLVEALNAHSGISRLVAAPKSTSLVPKLEAVARPGTKSALRGLSAFPPHTDGASSGTPPHFILIRCLTPLCEFPTYLISRHVLALGDQLQSGLSAGMWICRCSTRPHLSAVLERSRIRWDEDCMRPVDRIAKRMHEKFRDLLQATPMHKHDWVDLGKVLVIDNWQTLHSRGPILPGSTRILERLYVEVR